MTKTEAIARAIADELRSMGPELNARGDLRGLVFDVKLVPGTPTIRAVVVRAEFERIFVANGNGKP